LHLAVYMSRGFADVAVDTRHVQIADHEEHSEFVRAVYQLMVAGAASAVFTGLRGFCFQLAIARQKVLWLLPRVPPSCSPAATHSCLAGSSPLWCTATRSGFDRCCSTASCRRSSGSSTPR
jgi:hypothetical protein